MRTAGCRNRLSAAMLMGVVLVAVPAAEPAPEVYFSPAGGIQHRLLRAINLTKVSIELAVFDLTSGELAGALLAAHDRGVAVRIVVDPRQARGKHSEVPLLLRRGLKVRLASHRGRGLMHHKFAIFDRTLLVTGSYNWTDSAERVNHENVLILDESTVIRRYQARFEMLFQGVSSVSVEKPR